VLLDFDGSLAEIVARPELAAPVEGAREALGALARRYRVVAVVTGRRSEEVSGLLDVPGVRLLGVYGLEGETHPSVTPSLLERIRVAATVVPAAWAEDKGATVAVHFRQAPGPLAAREALLGVLGPIAEAAGLELVEGKMVVELMPVDRPRKGGAVRRLVDELDLRGVLFAGDDVADVEAYEELDRLEERGVVGVRVAVRGPETPDALLQAADVVVEGPSGLVELLRRLC
jgi:trehalose 6-phosphate phosphatase